jgi:hypothetical protein
VFAVAAALGLAGACGGSKNTDLSGSGGSNGGDASTVCVPGQSSACAGPKGCNGFQVCKSDGSGYAPCNCSNGGAGGAAGSGGTAGAAGSSGAGGSAGSAADTCATAAAAHGPYGCEFWPTVTQNLVWSVFDFAVRVANPGTTSATVTVTRGSTTLATQQIPAGQIATVYLPWVPQLKGTDSDQCGTAGASGPTVRVDGGAYKLVSTAPVAVYQFNAYEYQGAGGPSGKDWSKCPGTQTCSSTAAPIGCFSFSNDASLLLPSASLGKTYRVTGVPGWSVAKIGPYVSITATADATHVTVQLSSTADVVAGGGVPAATAGGTVQLSMNAGDVVSLASSDTSDTSGTLISSDKPLQVISGISCAEAPTGIQACDHLEESVLPARAWGRDYVVNVPSGPHGTTAGHLVRLYGHVDNTSLTYPSGTPPTGAPTTLSAGQVVGLGMTTQEFEVRGNQPFGVATILPGGAILDPSAPAGSAEGDPSQTFVVPVAQYRKSYAIVAAADYDSTFLDVVAPSGTAISLDGSTVAASPTQIGTSSYSSLHIPLTSTPGALHMLTGSAPFSVQVTGYGKYTSYEYPAGPDLAGLP